MTQRKVSASEFVADIRNGMSNADLQVKYHTSLENLERLFNKLVTAGHLKQSEIDSRARPPPEFNCPACGATQENSLGECPKCGIIVAKFKGPKEIPPTEDEKPHNGPSKETFNNKEAENNRQDNESNSFEDFANTGSKLEKCNVCSKLISKTAEICPNCGEKRFSNKTTVPVLGIVSVGLGVGASLMPYFAAVFLVPAAIICGAVAIKKKQKAYGKIAIILGVVGLAGILYTSYKISNLTSLFTNIATTPPMPPSQAAPAPVKPEVRTPSQNIQNKDIKQWTPPPAKPKPEPKQEPKQEHILYKLGDTVSIGYTSYTVLKSDWHDSLSNNKYLDAKPDADFLFIEIVISNDDKKPRSIPPLKLIDQNGSEYEISSKSWLAKDSIGILTSLNPGVSKRGIIVFDIPSDNGYNLKVSGGYWSNETALIEVVTR